MLELPEAKTMAKQLTDTIGGKTIKNVYANTSPHGFAFYFGDPALYHDLLSGNKIDRIDAYGGRVEICAGENRLSLNDGVNIRFFGAGEALPKKHQLHIEFDDSTSIVCTVQMYAGLLAFADGANDDSFYYVVAREKPSPLTDGFDKKYFEGLANGTKPSLSAKAFLATEQRIPGLGNGVLQDILFNAGINPRTKINTLSGQKWDAMFDSVKQTLAEMTALGGRDTEKDLFGVSGGYQTVLSSKTLKMPCLGCGGEVVRQAYLGGNVYFCPNCQPL